MQERLTKDNYENDLFEKQKDLIQIDEYTKIRYSQHMYNEDLWKTVKEKEDLEEEIGCPLEVRCAVVCGSKIYGIDGRENNVDYIEKDGFYCTRYFKWKDYGKKWFLENPRKDKSK